MNLPWYSLFIASIVSGAASGSSTTSNSLGMTLDCGPLSTKSASELAKTSASCPLSASTLGEATDTVAKSSTASSCIVLLSSLATRSRAITYPSETVEVQLQDCHEKTEKKVNDTLLLNYASYFCDGSLGIYMIPGEEYVQCIRDGHENIEYTFNITNNRQCSGIEPPIPGGIYPDNSTRRDELVNECQRIMWEAGA